MSSIQRPNGWLCVAAFAAAFWITLKVTASPARLPFSAASDTNATEVGALAKEVPDPILDAMIARFARGTRGSQGVRALRSGELARR